MVKFWAQGKEARGTSQTGLGNILHEGGARLRPSKNKRVGLHVV